MLYNIAGCCVYDAEKDISAGNAQEVLIDVSQLPSGIYILKTLINGREIISKCVILK